MRPATPLPLDSAKSAKQINPNSWCVLLYHQELRKVLVTGIKSDEDAKAFVYAQNRDTDVVSQKIIHGSCVIESDLKNASIADLENFTFTEKD